MYLDVLSVAVLAVMLTSVGSAIVLMTGRKPSSLVWGVTFGLCSVIVLLEPIAYVGRSFDFRHIPLVLAGYVGGPITALVAASMTGSVRFLLAGPHTVWGMIVILGSSCFGLLLRVFPLEQIKRPIFALAFSFGFPLLLYAGCVYLPLWGDTSWDSVAALQLPIVLLTPFCIYIALRWFLNIHMYLRDHALLKTLANADITYALGLTPESELLFVSKALDGNRELVTRVCNMVLESEGILRLAREQSSIPSMMVRLPRLQDEAVYQVDFSHVSLPYGETALLAMLTDITELSAALRQLEQFFSLSVDGFCIVGFDRRIQSVNQAFSTILGYSEPELLRVHLEEFIHPEDLPGFNSALGKMIHCRQPIKDIEIRCLTIHGEYKWVSWSAVPLSNEQQIYAIGRDVTEKREQERAISQLAAIVEHAEHAILSMDMTFVVQTANSATEKIFALCPHELVGRVLLDAVTLTPPEYIEHVIDHCNDRGTACTREFMVKRSDGICSDVIMTFSPMWDKTGHATGISLFARDISRQKTWEREMVRLDRLDLAGQLAAGIGHEIRNPMTTVRGFLQLFQKKPELKQYYEQMDLLISELDRANDIITGFLTLAQGRPSERSHNNLNAIINSLAPLLESDALLADKTVEYKLDDVPELEVNEAEVRQLILNLARNGLEAMQHRGKTLSLETKHEAERVCLVVRDQGEGIPVELQHKISTPFFTTKESGTGLGLSVCYSIAKKHGASIVFETGPTGTVFEVSFRRRNLGSPSS